MKWTLSYFSLGNGFHLTPWFPSQFASLVLMHLFLLYPLWCNYTNQLRGDYLVNHWLVNQVFDCCIWVVKNKVLHSFFECWPHGVLLPCPLSGYIHLISAFVSKQNYLTDQKIFLFWCWEVGESEILFILLFPSFTKSDNTGVKLTITGVALWSVQSLRAARENIFSFVQMCIACRLTRSSWYYADFSSGLCIILAFFDQSIWTAATPDLMHVSSYAFLNALNWAWTSDRYFLMSIKGANFLKSGTFMTQQHWQLLNTSHIF